MMLLFNIFFSVAVSAQTPEIYLQLGYKTGDIANTTGKEMVFSRDGALLAAVSGGNSVKIWETGTGREVQTLTGHGDLIKCLAFLPDNRRIISGGNDKTVRLWDITTGEQIRLFKGHQGGVRCLAVSADGSVLASLEDKAVKVWNIDTGLLITTIAAPVDAGDSGNVRPLRSITFSPDDTKLLFTNLIGDVSVAGIQQRRIISTISHEKLDYYMWALEFLGFTNDGKVILGGYSVLIFIDPDRLEATKREFKGGRMEVGYMSADGALVAGWSSSTLRLQVFDANLKERLSIPMGDAVTIRGYSPAKGQVAVSDHRDRLKLYDLETGKELQNFSTAALTPHEGRFSLDGAYISLHVQSSLKDSPSSGPGEDPVKVWNLKTAAREREFDNRERHTNLMKMFDSSNPAERDQASKIVKADKYYNADKEDYSEYDELNNCFYLVEMASFYGTPLVNIYRIEAKQREDLTAISSGNRSNWKIAKQFKAHDQKVTATATTFKHGYIATGSVDKTINLFSYPAATCFAP